MYLLQQHRFAFAVDVLAAVLVVAQPPEGGRDLEGTAFPAIELGLVDLDAVFVQELHFQQHLFAVPMDQLHG